MHRRKLNQLLENYAQTYPAENAVVQQFAAFVRQHENCFSRACVPGHVTGSAWVVDPEHQSVLLTHHRKLEIWLQLGGHSDDDADTLAVALREAHEESGLQVSALDSAILDIDIHKIPARKTEPEHLHYDVRFALVSADREYTVSAESKDLAWVAIAELERYTTEASILRMRAKWLALQ